MRKKLWYGLMAWLLTAGLALAAGPQAADAAGNGLKDTFSGGAGGWRAASGSWSAAGDEYVQSATANGTYWTTIAGKRWGDATYELDLKLLDNGGSSLSWAGLQFKKMGQDDGPFDSGMLLYVRANGTIELYKVNKALVSVATGLSFGTYRHLKVVNNAHNIKVYVNNETTPRIDYTDPTFASGYAGLAASTSSWAFDNVSVSGPDLPYTINVGSPNLLYADAQMPITMDASFATLRESASAMHFYHAEFLQHLKGPLDAPFQTYVSAGGSNLIDKNGFGAGYSAYKIWIMNMYEIAPGELLGFTHNEAWSTPQPTGLPTNFSLGIVYSTDGGATWEYCGEIVRPKNTGVNIGGVPYIVRNGEFYVYFNDGIYGEGDGMGYPRHVAVAKASVQDVVNAARNLQTTTWTKYVNGSWTGNAVTSVGSAVLDNTYLYEDAHSDAAYSTALGKYLMTVQTHQSSRLNLYSSSDGVVWSMEAALDVAAPGSVMQPYSTFVDYEGGTNDGREVDGAFSILYPRKTWGNYEHDDLYRRSITISADQADRYSASGGYGQTQGANGWSYEQWDGSAYSNMTWDAANGRWKGAQTYAIVGGGWQHPDANDSVRTWTAPKAGTVNVSGVARKADTALGGDGVQVKIMKNNTQIWPASGWQPIGASDTNGFAHNLTVSVAQNDKIRFVVNKGGTISTDATWWDPTIQYDLYEASSGFSQTQGANQWYYKQWDGSAYSDMTWDAANGRWKGAQTYVLVGSVLQHPDANDSVRAWLAPKAGKIRVSGTAKKEPGSGAGDGVNLKIMKNGSQIWPSVGSSATLAYNDFAGISHDVAVSVSAGDYIYFIVNKRNNLTSDGTLWNPTIQYTGL
ncbi:hypothetical protein [Cohnella sp. GCM10012308]|uniref:hypothetical protein n=1 Tax=Cohnella sp. GCM10012308 TaxID=3317329 RepID=UPI003611218B